MSRSPLHAPILAGREPEVAVLRYHLAAALDGRGSVVLIAGEAGIGKTSLAEQVCREAAEQGASVLIGRCYDLTETPPYGPWIDLFTRYRAAAALPRPPAGLALGGTVAAMASPVSLFEQVVGFFADLARLAPLAVFLDDLHWADPASLDLLRVLARDVASLPFLLLVTYRADEVAPSHPLAALLPALVRESVPLRINLTPLSLGAIRSLLGSRYGLCVSEEEALAAYLQGRAEGNALFTVELLRTLEERGVISDTDGRWNLGDLRTVAVPALLRQVIEGRTARLGEGARRTLSVAAVIGQEVPLGLWATVAGMGEDALIEVVEQAIAARLVDALPDGLGCRFVHALVREALYEGMVAPRRRAMHLRVADALIGSPDPDPDTVAYHLQQAGDARSAEWLIVAGERAERASAYLTTADRFERALALLGDGADAVQRGWLLLRIGYHHRFSDPRRGATYLDAAMSLALTARELTLVACACVCRGSLRCVAGDIGGGLADLTEGWDAAQVLSATTRTGNVLPWAVSEAVPLDGLAAIPAWLGIAGRFARARTEGESLVAELSRLPGFSGRRPARLTGVYRGLGIAYSALGLPDQAVQAFDAARAAAFAAADLAGQQISWDCLRWALLPYRTDDLAARALRAAEAEEDWELGRYSLPPDVAGITRRWGYIEDLAVAGAWETLRSAALSAREQAHGYIYVMAGDVLAPVARLQGDADLAWAIVRETLREGPATEPGNSRFRIAIRALALAAALSLDANDLPEARAWLDAHDRWLAWSGAVLWRSEGHALWARFHRSAGDAGSAHHHAEEALRHATVPRQPLALLGAHRLLGELDTDAGRFADAATHLDAALALSGACAAPYERALTLMALAELSIATGRHAESQTVLDEARLLCSSLDAKLALGHADRIVARLAPVNRPPAGYPAGLSTREVEVLRLLAGGRTNPEIASTLFLSAATVRHHVAHILAKTETENRAAAAAFAQRHGLV